jgi:hypothetical protein
VDWPLYGSRPRLCTPDFYRPDFGVFAIVLALDELLGALVKRFTMAREGARHVTGRSLRVAAVF